MMYQQVTKPVLKGGKDLLPCNYGLQLCGMAFLLSIPRRFLC